MIAPSACCLAHQAVHTPKQQLSTDTAHKNQPQLNETQGICGLHTVLSWAGHSSPTPPTPAPPNSLYQSHHPISWEVRHQQQWEPEHLPYPMSYPWRAHNKDHRNFFRLHRTLFCHSQMKSQLYSDQASAARSSKHLKPCAKDSAAVLPPARKTHKCYSGLLMTSAAQEYRGTPSPHNRALLSADNPLDQLEWASQEEPGLLLGLSGVLSLVSGPFLPTPLPSISHAVHQP